MSQRLLRGVIGLLGLLLVFGARAEVSGSATLVSDYRFRGVSLSDEKPAAQFSLAYDHSIGWYAGVFGSTTQFPYQTSRNLQTFSYLGYVRRMVSGLAWEAGAGYSSFGGYHDYDYPEIYCGLASEALSVRLYYAPDYFGQGKRTLYAELNGSRTLAGPFRLVGHIGALHLTDSTDGGGRNNNQFDLRAGIGIDLGSTRIELTAVTADINTAIYPVSGNQKRFGLVMGVSQLF